MRYLHIETRESVLLFQFSMHPTSQRTDDEYVLADRSASVAPVAFSLMASFMSAITLLGVTRLVSGHKSRTSLTLSHDLLSGRTTRTARSSWPSTCRTGWAPSSPPTSTCPSSTGCRRRAPTHTWRGASAARPGDKFVCCMNSNVVESYLASS